MIVRKFLSWSQTATAGERAEGASALARAYLYADLSEQDYDDAELALTTLLEDPSPLVRRAMAEAFARAELAREGIQPAAKPAQSPRPPRKPKPQAALFTPKSGVRGR